MSKDEGATPVLRQVGKWVEETLRINDDGSDCDALENLTEILKEQLRARDSRSEAR